MQHPRRTKDDRDDSGAHRFLAALACIVTLGAAGCEAPRGSEPSGAQPADSPKGFAVPAAGPYLPLPPTSRAGSEGGRISGALEALLAHASRTAPGVIEPLPPGLEGVRVRGGRVLVDAVAESDGALLERDLARIGLRASAQVGRMVSGFLPIAAIEHARGLASLRAMRPSWMSTHAGVAPNQGDVAMNADVVREMSGADGRGVAVGVLSDSFDCLGGAAEDAASGDLPSTVRVLADEEGCGSGSDEGRAMMQLVHDVAPGAELLFRTAFHGMADFARGIDELSAAGAQVVVDDVMYFGEPMFQDGILAEAVDRAHAGGVAYFSSAGNAGRGSYESPFRSSGTSVFGDGDAHDFDPSSAVDTALRIEIPKGVTAYVVLQWADPFFSVSGAPGAESDLHLYLTDDPPTQALAASRDANVGGDPVEILSFENKSRGRNGATRFNVVIEGVKGPAPELFKLVVHPFGVRILEHATESSSLYGHSNAAGAAAVCAAPFYATPEFGVSPPLLEPFSSAGGTPILFDGSGAPVLVERPKPDVCAPDGVNTTFFGFDIPEDDDAFPNFFGTSAAAPNAAAVAALLRSARAELGPSDVRDALAGSTLDMGVPGFDADSGHGLIRADVALELALATEVASEPSPPEPDVDAGVEPSEPAATEETGASTAAGSSRGCTVAMGAERGSAAHVPVLLALLTLLSRRSSRRRRTKMADRRARVRRYDESARPGTVPRGNGT